MPVMFPDGQLRAMHVPTLLLIGDLKSSATRQRHWLGRVGFS
jgi:hypothetical protein